MIKEISSEEHAAFVEMVTSQLSAKFMKQLCLLCDRRDYFTHAGILAEMLEWSLEFFELYYGEFNNFSEPTDVEETIVAFGRAKLLGIISMQISPDKYFLKKYKESLHSVICQE